jgi:hypothetical protein
MTETKRGAGRPPKPPGERTEARSIRLSQDDWAWLDTQGGATREIRALITARRAQQAGVPNL